MELTNEMKEKLKKAKTKEEVKKVLDEAGVELTDEDLDQAVGGCGLVEYAIILEYTLPSEVYNAGLNAGLDSVINPIINPSIQ